jgi:RNA polymerase sporulation-specific sigma factor
LAKYKVEIPGIDTSNLKVLTNEEMINLFTNLKKGDKTAKELIINGNLKLVLSIINKYNTGKFDMNDLFQIGCVGLIKAVDNFSLEYNCLFSTYAVPLIIGEVKRFIRDSSVVRISRSIRDNAYQILKYKDEYMLKYGIEPSNEEICQHLNINAYELRTSLESLVSPVSIFDPIYNDGGDTIYLLDQLADNKMSLDKDDAISMQKALNKINEREAKVLYARYIYGKTQMEIADDLGVSQAQISRIEKNAIKSIKRYMK